MTSDRVTPWNRFIKERDPEGRMPSVILQSWRRSESAGVEPAAGAPRFHRVAEHELQQRLEANADWLAIARPHLEWLAMAFGHIPHVICLTDRDGIVLHATGSESLLQRFHLSPGHDWSEARIGTNGAGTALASEQPVAVVGPQHFVSEFEDCTCTGAPVHTPDGTLLGAIDISTRVEDGSPERLAIVAHAAYAIGRELAYERQEASLKRIQRSLRESNDQFRQLANAMPQIVWVTRPDGYHEYYNQRWYDYIGCTLDQCLGHAWSNHLHPDDRQRASDRWQLAIRSGQPYEIEYRFRGKNGSYRWFLGRALPVRNEAGKVVRWFGTCTDIEDMKRADEALRQSEARYRAAEERLLAAVSASDTGTFRWSPDTGAFIDFDDSLKRLFGVEPGESICTTADFIRRVHPEDRPKLIPALDRCRQGAAFEMEYRVILPDGTIRWLYDRAKMMLDPQGRPAYLVGACTDITKRKRVEEALRDADRRKDKFLATLAHELRNPLAPIRTGLEVLKLSGDEPQVAAETRSMMEQQLQQMVRLIDDLLEVSRITRGKLQVRKQRTELASAIGSALDATRTAIESAAQHLTVDLPPEPIYLHADPVRLAQVFSNLLSNAAKYTDRGGSIQLTARRDDGLVVVTVRDNGIGISAEHLPHVFEMFSQADSAMERSQGGLGIGLSLVRELVKLHEGTVEARSEGPGKGSEFVVRLPVIRPAADQPAPPPTPHDLTTSESGCRILVVDDNKDAAHMLATLLKAVGHDVRTAYDGLQAVQMVGTFRPRLALLDIGMPKLNGYDAARRIRQTSPAEDIVLVAVTGWGQEEDKRRAREAGFDYHLTKPIEASSIQRLLAERVS